VHTSFRTERVVANLAIAHFILGGSSHDTLIGETSMLTFMAQSVRLELKRIMVGSTHGYLNFILRPCALLALRMGSWNIQICLLYVIKSVNNLEDVRSS
jgi:hypothetical protein